MFKYLDLREQLLEEKRKNDALQAEVKDLMDGIVELAEIVAVNEEAIKNG